MSSRNKEYEEGKLNKDEGMTPLNELYDRSRVSRNVKLAIELDGIEPVKLFSERWIVLILCGNDIGSSS